MSDLPDNVVSLNDYRKQLELPTDAILRVNLKEDEITFRLSALLKKLGQIAKLNGDKFSRYELKNSENKHVRIFDSPIDLMIYLETSPKIAEGLQDGTYVLEELTD